MNIVKQSTGNVVLTDASGHILKVFILVNSLDVVSQNEIIIKYGYNQWTSIFADHIDYTQIEPASAVAFSGNAYDLVSLLSSSFFFELSGGGITPTLAQVLAAGNTAGINYIDLDNNDLQNTNVIDFNLATVNSAGIGQLAWNDKDGTLDLGLKGGSVTLQIGQEQVARVVNKTSPLIDLLEANYQAVKIVGATGQRLSVALAQANNDLNSTDTIGIVTENIAKNQEGFICTSGQVHEINTTGSLQGETWNDGDVLYLSPTVAGQLTNVKPTAPQHLVVVGFVEYKHAIHGKIFVRVSNGYELNELHDVAYPTAPVNNEILSYNSSNTRWENHTIASVLGYTPVPTTRTLTINGTTQDLSANRTFTIANPEGWTVIQKSANQDVNTSTLTDDSELQFSVVAGGNYLIQMVIATSGDSSTNDYKFGFAVSSGTMNGVGNGICRNAANSHTVNGITASAAATTNSVVIGQNTGTISSGSGIVTATIDFGFYASANATFKFQFALNSGATTARTWKGSILKYKRLD